MNKNYRDIIVAQSEDQLCAFGRKQWHDIGLQSVKDRGIFTVCVSGGVTPRSLYRKISKSKKKELFSKTHVFWTDERFVPKGHEFNSFSMVNEFLLSKVDIPSENIYPMLTDFEKVEQAAKSYEVELKNFFGEAPIFDLMILGIGGQDGHVASLFPGIPELEEKERLVVSAKHPDIKFERISITFPVINAARNIIVLAMGPKKSEIVRKVVQDKCGAPANSVDPEDGSMIYLLDEAAAQELSPSKVQVSRILGKIH